MSRTLLLAFGLLSLTVTTSFAQRGSLTLGWNNCRVHGGGVQNVNFACDTNDGDGALLVGGFIANATSNLNSLNKAALYVDIYRIPGPLDPWWQFVDPPVTGCRPISEWSPDMGNTAGAICDRSYWSEVGPSSVALRWFYPSYMNNHATLRLIVTVDPRSHDTAGRSRQESHIFGVHWDKVGRPELSVRRMLVPNGPL